jgi:hypothetical protein
LHSSLKRVESLSVAATQKYLDTTVWCPLSNFKLKDGVIEPHKIGLMEAVDGSLYARCERHIAKVFIQEAVTVERILESSVVVREKQKRVRKEMPHGQTQSS